MGAATGFLWLAVVILAAIWALQTFGFINAGVDLGFWLPVLLVIALAGALFNMFVMPFLGRRRTTRTSASATDAAAPASGSTQQEAVQETRDRPSL